MEQISKECKKVLPSVLSCGSQRSAMGQHLAQGTEVEARPPVRTCCENKFFPLFKSFTAIRLHPQMHYMDPEAFVFSWALKSKRGNVATEMYKLNHFSEEGTASLVVKNVNI